MLEGSDHRGGAFALFLHPLPGAFNRHSMYPHPRGFAHFSKKNANAQGLARWGGAGGEGGGGALLELTDASIKIKCPMGSVQHCCILDSGLRDQSLSSGPGHCIVILDKKLYCLNLFLTQVQRGKLPN